MDIIIHSRIPLWIDCATAQQGYFGEVGPAQAAHTGKSSSQEEVGPINCQRIDLHTERSHHFGPPNRVNDAILVDPDQVPSLETSSQPEVATDDEFSIRLLSHS